MKIAVLRATLGRLRALVHGNEASKQYVASLRAKGASWSAATINNAKQSESQARRSI